MQLNSSRNAAQSTIQCDGACIASKQWDYVICCAAALGASIAGASPPGVLVGFAVCQAKLAKDLFFCKTCPRCYVCQTDHCEPFFGDNATEPCGSICCPPGNTCHVGTTSASWFCCGAQAQVCGDGCCPIGESCVYPTGAFSPPPFCCPSGRTCGSTCCPPCQTCGDGGVCRSCDACEGCVDGICGPKCPAGQSCCAGACCAGTCLRAAAAASRPVGLASVAAQTGELCCPPENVCNGQCVSTTCPPGQIFDASRCACAECKDFKTGCAPYEVCQSGVCVAVCPNWPPGSGVHSGTFVACPDPDVSTGVGCHCNSCGNKCVGTACCSCGCREIVTVCPC